MNTSSRFAKLSMRIGAVLLFSGAMVVVSYWVYFTGRTLFTSNDIPLPIRIAIPVLVVGLVMVSGSIYIQNRKNREHDLIEEIEY